MKCLLCHEDKVLLKKSHIIPNFMYKGLFGANHRLVTVNINKPEQKRYMNTGFYDVHILCAKCDNERIGRLETYASKHIYKLQPSRSHVTRTEYPGDDSLLPFLRIEHLDYTLTKLFFLSILWRCHISTQSFFNTIQLDEAHSERIRKMILHNNGGNEDQYQILLFEIQTDEPRPTRTIFDPLKIKNNDEEYYLIHINGLLYHFNISSKESMFEGKSIRQDGILDIARVAGVAATGYFDSYTSKPIPVKNLSPLWIRNQRDS